METIVNSVIEVLKTQEKMTTTGMTVWGTGESQTLSILWLPSIPAIVNNYELSWHNIPNTNIDEHKIVVFFGKIIKCKYGDGREGAAWKGRKYKVNFPTSFTSQVYILHLTLQYWHI